MAIEIRPATSADAAVVFSLIEELAIYENARDELWLTRADYEHYLDLNHFECHLAHESDEVLGLILFYPTFSTWKGRMIHLEDFIVRTDARRKGVGKHLMDHLIALAKSRNVVLIKWEVLDWNQPAIKFYEKYPTIFEKNWWNVKILTSNSAR